MKKRIILIVLALALVLSMASVAIPAQAGDEADIQLAPSFTVFMSADFSSTEGIQGYQFLPSSHVTLTVDQGADGSIDYEATVTVGGNGDARFGVGFPTVQEGDVVTLTDDLDPPNVKTHVVVYFTLTEVNVTTDTVTGTGRAGTELHVRAFDSALPCCQGPDIIVAVDGAGDWTADFSGIYDIIAGTEGWVLTVDPDGDHTQINWWVPLPEPGSWVYNPATGHYYALTESDLPFSQAETTAQSWGGHLVTIDDQVEQDWLYATFGSNQFWIGLNDIDTEGTFVWTSGAPVTYTNWCDGEPNDKPPGEDAVHYTLGGEQCWNDVMLDSDTYGIVEVAPPSEIDVLVDIKPGSDSNPLNVNSKGVLPVAILGTEDFDVTQVDPVTVLLGWDGISLVPGVPPVRWAYEDTNGDGFVDIVLKYSMRDLQPVTITHEAPGPLTMMFMGNMMDGTRMSGEDTVRIINKRYVGP